MIRSLYIIKKIFTFILNEKKLNVIRYSKKWKIKLDVDLKDYIEDDFMKACEKTKENEKIELKELKIKLRNLLILYFYHKIKYFNKIRRIKWKTLK